MEKIESDLAVIGAGLAGICAALSAAREGCKVALLGDRPVLGGNSSSEMRMWTRGATGGGNYYAEEMGILGEIKLENLYRNPEGNPFLWDEVLSDFVLRERNITLFLNTCAFQVAMNSAEKIGAVAAFQLAGERFFEYHAPLFIDATGDGTVGFLAGAEFRRGREGKNEFNELYAPESADDKVLGSSLFFQSKRAGRTVRFVPPDYCYSIAEIEKILNRGGRVVRETMSGTDFWWLEYGGTKDTIRDNQEITLELKRITFGVWNYIKNSGKFKADDLTLEWIGSLPGKRESRRFIGDYILTQKDILEHRTFEDGVCYGGWFLDSHPPEGIFSPEDFCTQIPVSIYQIPLRCLYSKNILNLIFAGRNISVTHNAFTSTRIMNTCGLTGQASGMLAARCVKDGDTPGGIARRRAGDVRQELIKNDLFVLGCRNEDPKDLARTARVSSSSVRESYTGASVGTVSCAEGVFILFPWKESMHTLRLLLDARDNTDLRYSLHRCEGPEGFRRGDRIREGSLPIRKGVKQEQAFPFGDLADAPYHLIIHPNESLSLHFCRESCTGFLGGRHGGNILFTPCADIGNAESLYGPDTITGGFHYPGAAPNLWISGRIQPGKPEWIMFEWNREITIREVRVFFNPDLTRELTNIHSDTWSEHHGIVIREAMPPELVRDYSLFAQSGGRWTRAVEIKENRKRLGLHRFDGLKADTLRIDFERTWGQPFAEVFEVRVYGNAKNLQARKDPNTAKKELNGTACAEI